MVMGLLDCELVLRGRTRFDRADMGFGIFLKAVLQIVTRRFVVVKQCGGLRLRLIHATSPQRDSDQSFQAVAKS